MDQQLIDFIIQNITGVMNVTQFIISMLLIVLVASCFLGRYVVLSKKLVLSSLGAFVLDILFSIGLSFIFTDGIDNDSLMDVSIILTVVLFIYSFVFYFFAFKEKRFLRALEATFCLYLLTSYCSSFVQTTAIFLAGGTEEVVNDAFYEKLGEGPVWNASIIISFAITLTLFIITYFRFYKPKRHFVIGIPYRILFIVWVCIFSFFPILPAVIPSENITSAERYQLMSFLYAIGIIVLGIAVPVIVIVIFAERNLREKNSYQEAYLTAQLEYIKQYKKSQVETRAFRHDLKNNLSVTSMMLEKGQVEEAAAHINDMLGNVAALSPKYVTGDEMLDLIVSMKADRMEDLNIPFTLDGVVDGGLNIKPMDMCSIFANALDNAIEAASATDSPSVNLNIKRTDKFFIIKITNSARTKVDCDRLLNSSGYTSKKDREFHGFGLLNIRRAIEDHNGVLKAESTDSTFTLSIILPRSS